MAFALGIVDKYAEYFAGQGVEYFNIGADEYANDLTTMGLRVFTVPASIRNLRIT